MAKTISFGIVHMIVAFSVAYLLTGSIAISGAITLVEPLANTVAFYFFDKHWSRSGVGERIEAAARWVRDRMVPASLRDEARRRVIA